MVKMTKNSAMEGLLEPIKNSAIWKSVLRKAVLREAQVQQILNVKVQPAIEMNLWDGNVQNFGMACRPPLMNIF